MPTDRGKVRGTDLSWTGWMEAETLPIQQTSSAASLLHSNVLLYYINIKLIDRQREREAM